jgi:glycosyltransferase involved in cell wall biosynthesis
MKQLRALVVSYAFPPVGGAGVQRVVKLVKYLPAHGVHADVLSSKDASVPLQDISLLRDVPASAQVLRARTFEPSYRTKAAAWQVAASAPASPAQQLKRRALGWARQLLVPDPQLLWLPAAHYALAQRLSARVPDDVIFISGPPFSQFLLAGLARLKRGTAVIFDYRDEWTMTSSGYEMSTSARLNASLERALVGAAHAITTATEEFRAALLSRFPALDPARVHAIPNGYDPEDFPDHLPAPSTRRFSLIYSGTVFRLTSAQGFLEGLRRLHSREPELAQLLDVHFVGRIVETEACYFQNSEAIGVSCHGYLDHTRAVALLAESHAALCILDAVDGVERIYPAKIFEIMRSGRPCLALTPEGALASLVRRHRLGEVVPPRDAEAIAAALSRMLRAFRDGTTPAHTPIDIERFDRRAQAGQFAEVFRSAHALAQASRAQSSFPIGLGQRTRSRVGTNAAR